MEKLKPCPFCGSKKLKVYVNAIYCECGGSMDFGHWWGANKKEDKECKEAVIYAWNKRTQVK